MHSRRARSQIAEPLGEFRVADVDPALLPALRSWLQSALRGCTVAAIKEAWIVLDELVANAFNHALPPFVVRLFLVGDGHVVRLEVDDGRDSFTVGWRLGRGLYLVRGLCESWGVEGRRVGKTVWAELPVLVPPIGG